MSSRSSRHTRLSDSATLAWWLSGLLMLCVSVAPACLFAQADAEDTEETMSVSPQEIRRRLKELTESELGEDQKTSATAAYDEALIQLGLAEEHVAEAAKFQTMIDTVDQTLQKSQADLAGLSDEVSLQIDPNATLADIEKLLTQAIEESDQAEEELQRLDAEPGRRQTRRAEIPPLRDAANERLDELKRQLEIPPPESEAREVSMAGESRLHSELQAVQSELALFDKELEAYDETEELLRAQRDLAAQLADRAAEQQRQLREMVNERRELEVEAEARQARLELARTHPSLRHLAERNQQLADDSTHLVREINSLTDELQSVEQSLARLKKEAGDVRQRVGKVDQLGLTEAMGMLLRKRRALMPDEDQYDRNRRERRDDIRQAQLILLDLDQERSRLALLDRRVRQIIADLPSAPDDMSNDELELTVRTLLERQKELLDALLQHQDAYFEMLVALSNTERQLAYEIRDYREFIDARILWVRSTGVLGLADVKQSVAAARWLTNSADWAEVGQSILRDAQENPLPYVGFVALFAAAVSLSPWLVRRLDAAGEQAADPEQRRYRPTLQAILITSLLASIGPAPLYFIAWRLDGVGGVPEFTRAFRAGVLRVADVMLAIEVLRHICRPGGLGIAHFDWSEHNCRIFRQTLALAFLALPLVFTVAVLMRQSDPAHQNSMARICSVIILFYTSVLSHRLLTDIQRSRNSGSREASWSAAYTTPRIWYFVGVILPLALIVLTVTGYFYTTYVSAVYVRKTALLLFLVLILGALIQRILVISRRKIAARQAQQREEGESASIDVAATRAASVDLSSLGEESRQLLKVITITVTLVGLWMIWHEAFPALGMLDVVELWDAEVDGVKVPITLRHLATALLILGVTVAAVRDLPAWLQLLLLNRLPFDFGARYALMTVVRYSLLTAGFVMAFQVIGVNWTQYQWLVAAATVGLGFGLQEIFGNFVSGLILLAERPIRVGDVVTVENITGTVTKVSMRSTVVTNWDRQEYIVPNKDFITGRVLNWTLSNAINRLVVNVRTATDCDPELARDVLLRVAHEHPLITDDPAPLATLEEFGDGTLNFALRCYLPDMKNRLGAIHELHAAIHRAFREADIEIAASKHDIRIITPEDNSLISSRGGVPRE